MKSEKHVLIIAEKPSAARKIALALSQGKPVYKKKRGAQYIEIERDGKKMVVVPAVGHLFTLQEKTKTWDYPVFDVEWVPTFTQKGSAYAKPYYENIRELARNAGDVIVATDLDIEGETIAYNILRFLCGRENAKRMEFSTLTKPDLERSFLSVKPEINHGMALAGIARHTLDYYFGINMSRALMSALKRAGRWKTLSTGRVQGPALAIVVEREKEIRAFVPTPYWQVFLELEGARAIHEKEKFDNKEEALEVKRKSEKERALVVEAKKSVSKLYPPTPFNLTDLQAEAFALFGMSPIETQRIAQELYERALISYPRTSSQQLPPTIGYKNIIQKLGEQEDYRELASILLEKKGLRPHNGKKTDEAHPAIYPTGEKPSGLTPRQKKIYDLIVKRFLATFGEPAERVTKSVVLEAGGERFIATGRITTHKGWISLYEPYARIKEEPLPPGLEKGVGIEHRGVTIEEKETQPPPRYNRASLVRELEKRGLGTKATRAEIVESLYKRGYVTGDKMTVTDLGFRVVETLSRFVPEIISERLTRHFEKRMEEIQEGKRTVEEVVREARERLSSILEKFRRDEEEIGRELLGAVVDDEKRARELGECECGGTLVIKSSRNGKRFAACTNYPECKKTYPLPSSGTITSTGKKCRECGTPIIRIKARGRRAWEMCLDPECPTKKEWNKKKKARE